MIPHKAIEMAAALRMDDEPDQGIAMRGPLDTSSCILVRWNQIGTNAGRERRA